MTTIFEDAPKVDGIRGDMAKVTHIDGRVLIRAIAMTPDQARALAAGIVAAADNAEAGILSLPDHAITGDEVLAGLPTPPDAVARLWHAARLGLDMETLK